MALANITRAMVLEGPGLPLVMKSLPLPVPAARQVLIRVIACGICRTELLILDGELPHPKLPLVPGHEVVGRIADPGAPGGRFAMGDLVGVSWIGYTCGACRYCLQGAENLCEKGLFTGYTLDGGYSEYMVAHEAYCFPLPTGFDTADAAPLMCAGLIGFRSYAKIPSSAVKIGIYGFGAAAHILIQVANFQQKRVYAFTRKGDVASQQFAMKLGAAWAGDSLQTPPEKLDAAIIFAPEGSLVVKALEDVDKAGTVICGGIHMSDIPSFPYSILWEERSVSSVANLTRKDGSAFLQLASEFPIHTSVKTYPLLRANEALEDLRHGRLQGAAVLLMDPLTGKSTPSAG